MSAKTVGKDGGSWVYLVSIDRKTTVYRLEADKCPHYVGAALLSVFRGNFVLAMVHRGVIGVHYIGGK